MRQNDRAVGSTYEQVAAEFLRSKGLQILEQNFRCRMGEIDLIARDGKTLVFEEVKFRRRAGSGSASAAVNRKKQQVIGKVATYYLVTKKGSVDLPCRFDVVAIDGTEIRWIPNAFDMA